MADKDVCTPLLLAVAGGVENGCCIAVCNVGRVRHVRTSQRPTLQPLSYRFNSREVVDLVDGCVMVYVRPNVKIILPVSFGRMRGRGHFGSFSTACFHGELWKHGCDPFATRYKFMGTVLLN